jgi:hypothetical protein
MDVSSKFNSLIAPLNIAEFDPFGSGGVAAALAEV